MPNLVLELGCEELPASFVRKAFADLRAAIAKRLEEAGIPFRDGEGPMGTPRRLIVHFREVSAEQPTRVEEKRGPSEAAAYDTHGNPTPALLGFCRGVGVDPSQVRREGGYVWAAKVTPGRPTREVLAEILPAAIRSLTFEKAMRWGNSRMRFARPIRWILASFDREVVPFEIEGVQAGLESRGHRFRAPEVFRATSLDELLSGLRRRFVEPDHEIRRERILQMARKVSTGRPMLDDALVEENVFLTEWPQALEGEFEKEFLELPAPVLITAMAKHERFFPVLDERGRLTNRFVSIWNAGEEATVRAGNEWVLEARFNDAKFFFEEDKKFTLEQFLEKTSGIVFQEKLGTIRQRASRLERLALRLAEITDADEREREWARIAGRMCKADLSTGLVSELASLQGVVGGEYARREGFPEPVCWAIASHYELDQNPRIENEAARTAVRVAIADQLDKLVGYLGLGMAPSGSSDPFGLRRAATMLIEAAWRWPSNAPFYSTSKLILHSVELYAEQGVSLDRETVLAAMHTLSLSRYEALLPNERHDFLDAVAEWALHPREVRLRLAVLRRVGNDKAFVETATRPINIVAAAVEKGLFERSTAPPADRERLERSLDSPEGTRLFRATMDALAKLAPAAAKELPDEIEVALRALQEPINAFFDSTMVMVEDPVTREARLRLLEEVCRALSHAGDLSKVVIEGD